LDLRDPQVIEVLLVQKDLEVQMDPLDLQAKEDLLVHLENQVCQVNEVMQEHQD